MAVLGDNCFYWKVGRTVFVSLQGIVSLSSGFNDIGTLSEGFRPAHGKIEGSSQEIRVTGVVKKLGSSDAGSTGTLDVFGSGLVRVWFPVPTYGTEPVSGQVFFDAD